MSIYSSSVLPHMRSAGQTHINYSRHDDRAQRPGYNTPTSTPQSTYHHSLLFSVSPQDIQFSRNGSSDVNRALYNHSRNSPMIPSGIAAGLASPYPIPRGSFTSSSSVSFSETLDTSPRSRMSDFRFLQSNVDGQLQHKHRPGPLNLGAPQHSSTPVLYNSGRREPLPVQNVYVGTPAALHAGSSGRSHRPESAVHMHGSVDEVPETPRTRANIMRKVAPIFARINSRAAAIGVTATLDGDLIYHK
ncbi:hypothetical protein DFS33DRAFT_475583 [Desarmillaria ectypa]|nr:hypothetical protein DFS33DRAFT_475583 [Desarmillaria ectypa]